MQIPPITMHIVNKFPRKIILQRAFIIDRASALYTPTEFVLKFQLLSITGRRPEMIFEGKKKIEL